MEECVNIEPNKNRSQLYILLLGAGIFISHTREGQQNEGTKKEGGNGEKLSSQSKMWQFTDYHRMINDE